MKRIFFFLLFLLSIKSLHVRIPAANKTILDKLYSSGITVGDQGTIWWDVYLENYKLDLLSSITSYENIISKKVIPDLSAFTSEKEFNTLIRFTQTVYKNVSKLVNIGQSSSGHEILSFILSNNPPPINYTFTDKKKILLIAGIHGNDNINREILIRLIKSLMKEPIDLMNNYEIHIIPMLNPDGFLAGTMTNSRGFDLNCNFKDNILGQITPLQSEVYALKQYINTNQFTLGGNLIISNQLSITYPRDNSQIHTIDDSFFNTLALSFVTNHSDSFFVGRGSSSTTSYGSMSGWVYDKFKMKMLDIGITINKNPDITELDVIWDKNKLQLLRFLESIKLF